MSLAGTNTPPGGPWIVGEYPSANRLNKKTFVYLTGAEMDDPTIPKIVGQNVICTASNSNYTADTHYRLKLDGSAYISASSGKHTHAADTDAAGGLFSDIAHANLGINYLINLPCVSLGHFMESPTSSGATASNDFANGRIVLNTGGTSGAYKHLSQSGVPIAFTRKNRFMLSGYVDSGSNLTARFGVGAETANLAAEVGVIRYGMEICDSTGTTRNWDCFVGNGVGRTAAGTSQPVARSNNRLYRMDYTPGISVAFFDNETPLTTITDTVPSGLAGTMTTGRHNVGFGIKTNANVTTPFKNFYVRALAFAGTSVLSNWYANP